MIDTFFVQFIWFKLRFTIFLFLTVILIPSYAQQIRILGSIYDGVIHNPVKYANIAVRDIPIGTCTNANGDFILNLDDSLINRWLDISCIGYKGYSLPIDSLKLSDTLLIFLHPMKYQLDDIIVVPGQNDAQTILKNTISRIDNNYSRKKYFLEAFFRDRAFNHMEDERTVRLTEAAISIHQNHYTEEDKTRIQIREIRNSNNYVESYNISRKKFLFHLLGGTQNPIYLALGVENLTQKKFLKKIVKSENYTMCINGFSFYDSTLVYIIDFKQQYFTFLFKKYKTTHTFTNFRYHINADDFSILKVESIYSSRNPIILKGSLKNDSIADQKIIQYRKFDGKYYPSYIFHYGGISDMPDKVDEKHVYHHEVEIMINELATRRRDYERIKNRNLIKKNIALWDFDSQYNPDFWENYNVLLEHPLVPKYKKDLEFEKPLEEQFKKK